MEDLRHAIEKVLHQKDSNNQLIISNLLHNYEKPPRHRKLVLSDAENMYLIGTDEIIRCESESNYTRFFLTEKRNLLIAKTLKEYALMLDKRLFFRAHCSHIINLSFFSRLEKKDGGIIHLKDGSTLPVAVRRKDDLLDALNNL